MIINTGKEVDVVKSFKRRKGIVKILLYVAGLGLTLTIFSFTHRDPTLTDLPYTTEIGIWIGVLAIALIIAFFVWRCPVCNHFLGFRFSLKSCHNCQVELVQAQVKREISEKEDYRYYIKLQKANTKKFWFYTCLVLLLNFGLMVILAKYLSNNLAFFIIITLIIPIFVLQDRLRRCPKCGHHYGRWIPEECPECKAQLKDYNWSDFRSNKTKY
jgi:hypothetical protein